MITFRVESSIISIVSNIQITSPERSLMYRRESGGPRMNLCELSVSQDIFVKISHAEPPEAVITGKKKK